MLSTNALLEAKTASFIFRLSWNLCMQRNKRQASSRSVCVCVLLGYIMTLQHTPPLLSRPACHAFRLPFPSPLLQIATRWPSATPHPIPLSQFVLLLTSLLYRPTSVCMCQIYTLPLSFFPERAFSLSPHRMSHNSRSRPTPLALRHLIEPCWRCLVGSDDLAGRPLGVPLVKITPNLTGLHHWRSVIRLRP
ncbi:hypothetical protein BJV78DRAFT_801231 [Lactifluus subvellereus]|nr:hypothetical protein BJV78DRAFT_801231 [Lactifluus subvellereus]